MSTSVTLPVCAITPELQNNHNQINKTLEML